MTGRALAISIASTIVLFCCTSGDYEAAPGTETGPCFTNGTCNAGLVCASDRCVHIDSSNDGGTGAGDAISNDKDSGGGNDAIATNDSGTGQCERPTGPPKRICEEANQQIVTCTNGTYCCVDDPGCVNDNAICNAPRYMDCLSPDDCETGNICCAEAQKITGTAGSCIQVEQLQRTECKPSCDANELRLCWGDGAVACSPAGLSCVGAKLKLDFLNDSINVQNVAIGVCN